MKTSRPLLHLCVVGLAVGFASLSVSSAADLYWDTDGAIPGFGASPRNGTWGTDTFWSTSTSGNVATTAWPGIVRPSTPDTARFQGGNGTITVSGTQTTLLLRVHNTGNYSFTGGTINLEAANFGTGISVSSFDGDNGNAMTISSGITLGADGGSGTREVIFGAGRTAGTAGINSLTLNGSISAGAGARATGQLIQLRPQTASALGSATITQTASSVISNGSQTVSMEFGTRVAAANSGRIEIKGTNTYTGTTRIGSGTTVIYGDASNSVAGAFGNNANAIDIGFAQVLSTSQATLLTNGARTVGKAINIGNGLSSISDYAVTLGGETADTSTFSGNIDLDGSVARTTKVALTAASGGTVNFSGLLSHGTSGSAVPIEKIGLGTVNLSRAAGNTYTGNTTVSVGTLLVNNTAGSGTGTGSVAVNSGGTLGGNGTISGAVTVNSGGTLSPGNSPGLLTQGATTLEGGGNYNWQIADALGLAGTGYDSISLTSGSALTLNNTSVSKFNINLWSLSGISPDVNGDANFFNNSSNYSWTLIATDQVIGGFAADKFAINITATNGAEGFANTLNGSFSVALADGGTDLNLVYTAVPEPSTWALLAGSLTVVTILRRRRR